VIVETPSQRVAGTASAQGELWGARARDWADLQEGLARPLYESVLRTTGIGTRTGVLDVGCGAGLFCVLAAERGARVAGIDATAAFIAIAKERVPDGDFRVGEMEVLPYEDNTFDVVTGFNSFQFAANPVNALREARRVAKPGSAVVTATWGKPELCEAAAFLAALRPFLPPPPPGAPGPFALSADGALEALVDQAGLAPKSVADVDCPFEYPDLETLLRGLLSAGPAVKAIQVSGEARVRDAVTTAMAPFRLSSGGYRLENTFRFLIATA
jgi:SAM-dependent methyltransferase